MSCMYHTAKFDALNLSELWEEAAGHVDFHLSDQNSYSYRTEPAATWRSLSSLTQRSYIVVALKRLEKQETTRMVTKMEAYMMLLNGVFELLWATSNDDTKLMRKHGRSKALPATSSITPDSTATVLPLSAAWYSLTRVGGSQGLTSHPHYSALYRGRRRPTSPLRRLAHGAAENDTMEQPSEPFEKLGVSDGSDTSIDW